MVMVGKYSVFIEGKWIVPINSIRFSLSDSFLSTDLVKKTSYQTLCLPFTEILASVQKSQIWV